MLNKIITDNSFKINYDFDYLYYDIETVSKDNNFPKYDNSNAFITSIQTLHNGNKYIYTLDLYKNLFDIRNDITYIFFWTEQQMCEYFV